MCNVHSHGFQRGMAGLTEYRGPEADNFWSWRTLMYRFVARMTPDDLEAVTAQAYVEMLESGFTRVGEFHYVHHDPDGMPYADPAEMARARGRGGRAHRHRPHAAAGVLRAWRFRRRAAERRPAPLRHRRRRIRAPVGGRAADRRVAARRESSAWRRIQLRAVTPDELARSRGARARRARCTSTPPNRPAKWSNASRGRARGRCNGCWTMRRWTAAGAWCMPRT